MGNNKMEISNETAKSGEIIKQIYQLIDNLIENKKKRKSMRRKCNQAPRSSFRHKGSLGNFAKVSSTSYPRLEPHPHVAPATHI